MKKYLSILFVSILFLGCGRNYFEPQSQNILKPIYVTDELKSDIIFFTKDVATLKNGKTLPFNTQLPKGFLAIDKNLSKHSATLRVDGKEIKFDNLIVTATKKDELVAILFGDNHFELYNLEKGKTIFSKKFEPILALRKFVAKPYFYKELLLIPTLDGKLTIFDLKTSKIVRSVVVSDKDYFNNIIYLNVKNDSLIVASRDKVMVVAPQFQNMKSYNIKHILVDDSGIYIFTIEGDVKKLNFQLKELKTKQFKYANIIFPIFYHNRIYFLSRGDKSFLISIDKNLTDTKITPLKVYVEDDKCYKDMSIYLKTDVFAVNGVYYIGDRVLKLK